MNPKTKFQSFCSQINCINGFINVNASHLNSYVSVLSYSNISGRPNYLFRKAVLCRFTLYYVLLCVAPPLTGSLTKQLYLFQNLKVVEYFPFHLRKASAFSYIIPVKCRVRKESGDVFQWSLKRLNFPLSVIF